MNAFYSRIFQIQIKFLYNLYEFFCLFRRNKWTNSVCKCNLTMHFIYCAELGSVLYTVTECTAPSLDTRMNFVFSDFKLWMQSSPNSHQVCYSFLSDRLYCIPKVRRYERIWAQENWDSLTHKLILFNLSTTYSIQFFGWTVLF